jgi:acyl-CoA thioester hydrolase
MKKPADALLQLSTYPHVVRLQTRFADIDMQVHINSIRMAEIFEEARFRFVRDIKFTHIPGIERRLVAALNHTYLEEAHYPGDLEMGCGFAKIGRTSWTLAQAAFQKHRCVALCEITIVGANASGPAPLPESIRQPLMHSMLRT